MSSSSPSDSMSQENLNKVCRLSTEHASASNSPNSVLEISKLKGLHALKHDNPRKQALPQFPVQTKVRILSNPYRRKRTPTTGKGTTTTQPSINLLPKRAKRSCPERLSGMQCSCVIAKLIQKCGSCDFLIQKGECIVHDETMGWCHLSCECDNDRLQCKFLFRHMLPLSPIERQKWEKVNPLSLSINTGTADQFNEDTSACAVLCWQDKQEHDAKGAFGLTAEQLQIVQHVPAEGEIIRVKARAGTGKTTTVCFLCHELLEKNPSAKILYVVFTANCCSEAKSSGKFPKSVSIMTSHAYAMHCMNMRNFNLMKAGYDKKKIVDFLKLKVWLRRHIQFDVSNLAAEKWCKRTAHNVTKTLETFQTSEHMTVQSIHVPWNACGKTKVEGQNEVSLTPKDFVLWAQSLFDQVHGFCSLNFHQDCSHGTSTHLGTCPVDITFDGCLKSCQLLKLQMCMPKRSQFDHIVVDECQDMNACQANLLWGSTALGHIAPTVHIVGDDRQRLYRFRRAGRHFENCKVNKEFHLTGSFRFGKTIADAATLVLQHDQCSTDKVKGLADFEGNILDSSKFQHGVVVCRTNNGIYKYLESHRPKRWSLYSSGQSQKPTAHFKMIKELMRFGEGLVEVHTHDGQDFNSLTELENYCADTDNYAIGNKIKMVRQHIKDGTDVEALFDELEDTYVPDWTLHCKSADEFEGVILLTCHRAKGLEFNNVCVTDDFRFLNIMELEKEDILAKEYIREMIDLVYVTFTRAKKHLYLFPEAMAYVQWLRNNEEDSKKKATNDMFRGRTWHDLREDFECQWQFFVFEKEMIVSLSVVPFPDGPTHNLFYLDSNMSFEEQTRYCKLMLLRYHPDKFFANFRCQLPADETLVKDLKDKLNEITQKAMHIRNDLRPMEQD